MSSSSPVVIGLCAATLCATAYLIATKPPAGDEDRIAELTRRLEAAEKRADSLDSLRAELVRIRQNLERRGDRSPRAELGIDPAGIAGVSIAPSGTQAAAAAGGSQDGEGAPAPRALEDVVAERVEKKVAEKMEEIAAREKDRGDDGKWKPPMDDLAKELKLTDAQKAEAAKIFDSSRDQAFVLLKTQRLDGGSLLDDFAAALKSGGDAEESTKQFFQRIFNEKVPGSDQTYLAEFIALHQDVHQRLSRQLGKDQIKRLDALRVDLLDVKTGYDPVGDYIRAKLQ
jgi:hypothetical protein